MREQNLLSSFAPLLERGEIDKSRMNRLIWGDNLLAMQALLASGYEGKINLIYIDPPFWTGENYYANIALGGETITKAPSVIERIAYKDYWEGGIDSYLDMLYPRLQLMKRLLSDTGMIYVHTDHHVGHYVKVVLDEIFGHNLFVNEIIWSYLGIKRSTARKFPSKNDFILSYAKSDNYTWNVQYKKHSEEYLRRWKKDAKGRYFRDDVNPTRGGTRVIYLEERGEIIDSVWDHIPPVNPMARDRTGFPTQKPVELVKTIIAASTNEGDLVADFFCGSGTTLLAAEQMEKKRKWIGCDFSKVAIQVTRSQLVMNESTPFLLENIGNYQRQLIYLTGSRIYEIQPVVLKLYGAIPRKDFTDLGIRKQDDIAELVYVSYPDRPVSAKKAGELEALAERLDGRGFKRLVILGWDYEYNFDELLAESKRHSKRAWRTEIVTKTIPPEVYEYLKKAKSEEEVEAFAGKVKFHDKPFLKIARLSIQPKKDSVDVNLGIERYVVFDYPIEDDNQRKELDELLAKDPLALIDYWAIDWDYDGITFKSTWQAVRQHGREIKPVPRTAAQSLAVGRKYTVAVRVVDVFGNDASKTLEINVGRRH